MALKDYLTVKPVIETPRLRLRPMTREDVPALREWMPDDSLYSYWGKGPGKTDKHPEELFAHDPRPQKSFHLGIALRDSNRVIGELWVYQIENDRMATLAVRLAAAEQGKGYGTEGVRAMVGFCFAETELQRIRAEVDVRNIASRRMLEKSGFTKEGTVRQGKMVNTWCDYDLYAILKSDWRETV